MASEREMFHVARPENDEGAQWKKRKDIDRFMQARNGDMLSAPFQCDHCWFVNLTGQEPDVTSEGDVRLMVCIRRVNLDVMWSREESTVRNTLGNVKKGRLLSEELGLPSVNLQMGPWPVGDALGFQVAIELLCASQRKGRNRADYTQFDSIRKLRAAYSNAFQVSPEGLKRSLWMKWDNGRIFGLTSSPTDSVLFRMFALGCEKRMGRIVIQEMAFSIEVVLNLLEGFEEELASEEVDTSESETL